MSRPPHELPLPDASATSRMAEVLAEGGVVVFPTETVYCVGARADRPAAIARVRSLRSAGTLVPHLASAGQAAVLLDPLTPYQEMFLARLWPGPVSVTFAVSGSRQGAVCEALHIDPSLVYHAGAITLRCPDHTRVRQQIAQAGGVVLGATAPGIGGGAAARHDELSPPVHEAADLVLDDGPTKYGRPSTLVELTAGTYNILRPGALEPRLIERMLKTTLLFVCSGNTCRSPMAEAIARAVLSQRPGVSDLSRRNLSVVSAGVGAIHGLPASDNAVAAARELGGDLSRHQSQPLTDSLIRQADLILTMTRGHRAAVLAMEPTAEGKTITLDPGGDIMDPIGADLPTYRELASKIKQLIQQRLAERKLI